MELQSKTDIELINSFLCGSEDSFEELISRYETKAYNLAMKLTRNQEDAEEVLQDVFVTVYRKLSGFEGKSAFSSWLYRITVNAAFMKLRKRKSKKASLMNEAFPQHMTREASEAELLLRPDNQMSNKQLRQALNNAVGNLPEEYRAVFALRDIDGLSNKEVGEILDLSIPAVKSRLHRSRMMLRKRLQRWYDTIRLDQQLLANSSRTSTMWTSV